MIGDPQPSFDDCSAHGPNHLVKATGPQHR